jgi:hypothetical protein
MHQRIARIDDGAAWRSDSHPGRDLLDLTTTGDARDPADPWMFDPLPPDGARFHDQASRSLCLNDKEGLVSHRGRSGAASRIARPVWCARGECRNELDARKRKSNLCPTARFDAMSSRSTEARIYPAH